MDTKTSFITEGSIYHAAWKFHEMYHRSGLGDEVFIIEDDNFDSFE